MTFPRATHSGDPSTAHAAEQRMNTSGKRATHAQAVLAAVRASPGLTAAHYGDLTGQGHIESQRRLSDLQAKGEVRKGAPIAYEGRRMASWRIAGDEEQIAMEM